MDLKHIWRNTSIQGVHMFITCSRRGHISIQESIDFSFESAVRSLETLHTHLWAGHSLGHAEYKDPNGIFRTRLSPRVAGVAAVSRRQSDTRLGWDGYECRTLRRRPHGGLSHSYWALFCVNRAQSSPRTALPEPPSSSPLMELMLHHPSRKRLQCSPSSIH